MPDAPFEFQFVDDTVKNMYRIELQLQRASRVATIISIIIVVMGIIGLTALTINLRLKEVGIRKVLGASTHEIIWLFSKEFYVTFIIAVLIGCPLIYLAMDHRLSNYTTRIAFNLKIFAFPIMSLILLLLCITISVIIGAIRANPIESLRDE